MDHLRPNLAAIQSPTKAVTTAGKKTEAVARPSCALDGLWKYSFHCGIASEISHTTSLGAYLKAVKQVLVVYECQRVEVCWQARTWRLTTEIVYTERDAEAVEDVPAEAGVSPPTLVGIVLRESAERKGCQVEECGLEETSTPPHKAGQRHLPTRSRRSLTWM